MEPHNRRGSNVPVQRRQVQGAGNGYQQPVQQAWTLEDSVAYADRVVSGLREVVREIDTYGAVKVQEVCEQAVQEYGVEEFDTEAVVTEAYRFVGAPSGPSVERDLYTTDDILDTVADVAYTLRQDTVHDGQGYDLAATERTLRDELAWVDGSTVQERPDVERLRDMLDATYGALDGVEDWTGEPRQAIVEDVLDGNAGAVDSYFAGLEDEVRGYVREVAAFEQEQGDGAVSDAVPARYGIGKRLQGDELAPDSKGFY